MFSSETTGYLKFYLLQICPIHIILVIFVFWYFVKYIAFVAIGYSVFLLLIQPLYGRIFVHLRYVFLYFLNHVFLIIMLYSTKTLQITDERIKIMSEIIKSMRIVKMYCWELAFVKKICLIRK